MEIDLFTFVAQIVNFLVLLLLLRIFLYKRVVAAMEERKQRIASRLEEADEKAAKAEEEAASYREMKQELDGERERLMQESRREAESRRKEMIDEARREVAENKEKWERAVQDEQTTFLRELKRRAAQQVTGIVARVLQDLADSDLEDAVLEVFASRLAELSDEEKEQLAADASDEGGAVIRSAFDLSEEQKDGLRERVSSRLGIESALRFQTDAELICGVELEIHGRQVSWNVRAYLQSLEEELSSALAAPGERPDRAVRS